MHNVKQKMYFYEENLYIMQFKCINQETGEKEICCQGKK